LWATVANNGRVAAFIKKKEQLDLFDQACFESFDRNPEAFDASVRQFHANALKVWAKCAFRLFDELEPDTAALFALTFVDNATTFDWTFSCNCANS